MRAIGTAARSADSAPLIASASCSTDRSGRTRAWRRRAARRDRGAGSLWLIRRRTARRALEAGDDPVEVGLRRRLADQQALHLDRQDDGDDDEQDADGDRADGVPAGLVGEVGQQHAGEGEEQADLGADVLEQHDGQLGRLRLAQPRRPRHVGALDVAGLLVRRAQRHRLEDDGDEEDADGDRQVLDLVGVAQLGDALVEGEQAAHREQHEGDDEGPEVALPAVAERVLAVGGLAGPLAAEQQQRLVAGVGQRVERLGQQARRAGDQEADELGDGDAEVGEEGVEDALRLPSVTGRLPRLARRSGCAWGPSSRAAVAVIRVVDRGRVGLPVARRAGGSLSA